MYEYQASGGSGQARGTGTPTAREKARASLVSVLKERLVLYQTSLEQDAAALRELTQQIPVAENRVLAVQMRMHEVGVATREQSPNGPPCLPLPLASCLSRLASCACSRLSSFCRSYGCRLLCMYELAIQIAPQPSQPHLVPSSYSVCSLWGASVTCMCVMRFLLLPVAEGHFDSPCGGARVWSSAMLRVMRAVCLLPVLVD